jgi:hypothetical protein
MALRCILTAILLVVLCPYNAMATGTVGTLVVIDGAPAEFAHTISGNSSDLSIAGGTLTVTVGAGALGTEIDDTEMQNEDFGDFSCDGTEDGCTLDGTYLDATDIGVSVQAYDAQLASLSTGSLSQALNLSNYYLYDAPNAIADGDTDPDVSGGRNFITVATAGTTIADFDAGGGSLVNGQEMKLLVAHANWTFDFTSSGLKGHNGIDWSPSVGDELECDYDGTDWYCTVSRPSSLSISTLILPFGANPTTGSEGSTAWDSDDDAIEVYDGSLAKLIDPDDCGWMATDPGAHYDVDTELLLFEVEASKWAGGFTFTEWSLSCNVAPDTEINADLRYADAWIGLANPADIDEIDTTSGTSSEATPGNINGGAAVAVGKVIYIGFDGDPEGTCVQMIFKWCGYGPENN